MVIETFTITSLVSSSCSDATQHRVIIVVCLNQVEVASVGFSANSTLASVVVQRLDNSLHVNHYLVHFANTYPLDRDLYRDSFIWP